MNASVNFTPLSRPCYAEKVLGVKSLREEIVGVTDRLFSGILFLMILRYPGLMIRLQVVQCSHWRLWHIMYRASCSLSSPLYVGNAFKLCIWLTASILASL